MLIIALHYADKEKCTMTTVTRWQPFRGATSIQDQVDRLFEDTFARGHNGQSDPAVWAPAVDIYETEQELVVKADLPEVDDKDIDIRVENNTLTIRGERKFEKNVDGESFLRVERAYGAFTRSFSLPNTIQSDGIHAEHKNGVLTVHMPKREESKPKQVKVNVSENGDK
jgi:HSP20 family protein